MRNPGSRSGAPMLGAARWQSRRAAERAVRRPGDVHELLGVHGRPTHTQATERALKATRSILHGKPTQNATTSRQLQLQSDNWTRQDKWTIVNEMSREAAGAAAPAAGGAAAVAGAAAAAASGAAAAAGGPPAAAGGAAAAAGGPPAVAGRTAAPGKKQKRRRFRMSAKALQRRLVRLLLRVPSDNEAARAPPAASPVEAARDLAVRICCIAVSYRTTTTTTITTTPPPPATWC